MKNGNFLLMFLLSFANDIISLFPLFQLDLMLDAFDAWIGLTDTQAEADFRSQWWPEWTIMLQSIMFCYQIWFQDKTWSRRNLMRQCHSTVLSSITCSWWCYWVISVECKSWVKLDADMTKHCTMAQALKEFGIKDLAKNDYLCPHFLVYQLFQIRNIWEP